MSQMVRFKIDGEPCGKGRPKFSTAGGYPKAYTPAKTRNYETWVKASYRMEYSLFSFDDVPLKVELTAFSSIPNSWSKKKRLQALDGTIYPTKKPDADNIAKTVLDALNGIAFPDDKQIVELTVKKRYAEKPRVEVLIEEVS